MHAQTEIRERTHAAMIGGTLPVMIDGESDESELLLDGRHEGQAPDVDGKVIVCDGSAPAGTIVPTRVLSASAHELVVSMDLGRAPDSVAAS
jgi:ribosomal protein S12 methylthiotransferase